jgi:hypothetical protein
VLQADVGDLAVVDHRRNRWGKAHGYAVHLISLERVLAADRLDPVERPLDRRADGPFLDVGLRDFVALAKLLDQPIGLRFGA